jgi:TPR repeat protein
VKPIEILLRKADDIVEGLGEPFEDWRDALEIYQKAAHLGSKQAYYKIGDLYYSLKGRVNLEKAILNHKHSLKLGYLPSSAALAIIYEENKETENSLRMWKYFFERFSLDEEYANLMKDYAYRYIVMNFNNKEIMKEVQIFKDHFKMFEHMMNEGFQKDVALRINGVKERFAFVLERKAQLELSISQGEGIDLDLKDAKEELAIVEREAHDLQMKSAWYIEFSAYFSDCLNGKVYNFK